MTWVDAIPVVLVLGYGIGGYFAGVIRRLIGLVALYAAFVAATNMGLQAGSIMQQSSAVATPDSRIYGFFGIAFRILIVVEGAAPLVPNHLPIEANPFHHLPRAVVRMPTAHPPSPL